MILLLLDGRRVVGLERFGQRIVHLAAYAPFEHSIELQSVKSIVIRIGFVDFSSHRAVDATIHRRYHVANNVWFHLIRDLFAANLVKRGTGCGKHYDRNNGRRLPL